jgi:nucleotide-binding universal stress UspA family protein
MLPIRTILHPTDFSEYSGYAFRLACALARDYGARLVVLHVAAPPVVVYGEGVLPPAPEDYQERLMGSVAEQVVRKAPCPVLTVKTPQRQPSPGEEAPPATAETAVSGER